MHIFKNMESRVRGYIHSFPVIFKSAKGSIMVEENDNEYIDLLGGTGTIEDLASGETHQIHDGVIYALNNNGRHILRGGTEDMPLFYAFNPPVTGREVHDNDGSYELSEEA